MFESEFYKDMKLEVAYSVLKDRLELSLSRGWIDEDGAIYLVYSNVKLMALLGCSKSKLLSIKKTLQEHGLIDEIQQSSSEKGRLANRIYLEELEHESTPVLNSATSETEVSDSVSEDDEEKESQTSRKRDNEHFQRKVARVTRYDRDYI
ncbi:hypothetical protein Sp14A_08870 [Streptococcus pluranimalium]|uniref:Replication initiator A N-terminal domain-containing protein n=1 Tax=Streptococcus pluranimalium TaxID=82348 RepID=A0A345VJA6_9STRE|nr:hypothetical protein Sp14A_08870 [Streptococcus pluranimalium]